jgi:hypothetical protein
MLDDSSDSKGKKRGVKLREERIFPPTREKSGE